MSVCVVLQQMLYLLVAKGQLTAGSTPWHQQPGSSQSDMAFDVKQLGTCVQQVTAAICFCRRKGSWQARIHVFSARDPTLILFA